MRTSKDGSTLKKMSRYEFHLHDEYYIFMMGILFDNMLLKTTLFCRRKLPHHHHLATCSLAGVCHLPCLLQMASLPVQVWIFVVVLVLVTNLYTKSLLTSVLRICYNNNYITCCYIFFQLQQVNHLLIWEPQSCQVFQACHVG